MQTILQILKMAGGWHPGLYLKIDNAPYMELVIEAMDESGPMGLPALSVAHYGEQNGDHPAQDSQVLRRRRLLRPQPSRHRGADRPGRRPRRDIIV